MNEPHPFNAQSPAVEDFDLTRLHALRHSAAHVLADAICRCFPETLLGFGPATEEGFYYDVRVERPLSSEELGRIEDEMRRIIREDHRAEVALAFGGGADVRCPTV